MKYVHTFLSYQQKNGKSKRANLSQQGYAIMQGPGARLGNWETGRRLDG